MGNCPSPFSVLSELSRFHFWVLALLLSLSLQTLLPLSCSVPSPLCCLERVHSATGNYYALFLWTPAAAAHKFEHCSGYANSSSTDFNCGGFRSEALCIIVISGGGGGTVIVVVLCLISLAAFLLLLILKKRPSFLLFLLLN